jgi:magnesium-transporting ATPase (P-type)
MKSRALIASPIIFILSTIGYIVANNVLTLPLNANYVTYAYLALNFILSLALIVGYKPVENFVNKLESKFEHFTANKLAGKGNYIWLFIIIMYVAAFIYTTISTSSLANNLDVLGLNFNGTPGMEQLVIMAHTANIVLVILNNLKAIKG